jgi:hypothetical protein
LTYPLKIPANIVSHYRRLFFTCSIFLTHLLLLATYGFSQQTQFSLSTDFGLLRSFKKQQQYWAVGQTVTCHFHFTKKSEVYAWITYFSQGKFTNRLTATAKSAATNPQQLSYNNTARLSFRHVSIGWKHYLKGASNSEDEWGLYAYAGLGLMLGKVSNAHSLVIDSADYILPVLPGTGRFKRLTLDLGLGYEVPVGGDVFLYLEGRALVPTTDYPSNYLFINKYAPFTASANVGFRILFD